MENNQSYEYDEISLKELIEVVLKGKKIIAGITIIVLLFAFAFTFYIQKPVYESKTTLLAKNVTAKVTDTNIENMQDYINNLSIQSLNTLETYKQQIKSPEVLNDVIESLELNKDNYSIDRLNRMISVSIIKDTNLLEITVKSGSPEISSKIANGVSDSFINFINNINRNSSDQSVEFLKIRVDEQSVKLDTAMKKYENFLNENENIDSVRNEMEILLNNQKEYQNKFEKIEFDYNESVLNNDINIKTTENKLNEVKRIISLNELNNARETYKLLFNKYNETKITESVKAGEMNLVINSKAYASDNPVSPNKKLNIAIALVLGLMMGVFIVFFMNMWKPEDVKSLK